MPIAGNRLGSGDVQDAMRLADPLGTAIVDSINKGELKMNITTKLFLASVFALSIVAPVQAQSSKQGDYYAPGQTTPQHATPGQEQKIQQGDYYKPDSK